MQDIMRYLQGELPRINAFLDEQAAALDPVVRPSVEHVLAAGGKRLRPLLTILTARALGAGDEVYPLACSLELLHSATLLHDDILDDAQLRRGRQAAHLAFGKSTTILAGDVLLALANRLVADYGKPRLTAVLSEAIMRTVTGEVMEIANVRNTALSHQEYMDIITGKTAYLFQGACQCGAILAEAETGIEQAAHDYGLSLGIAFQLVDDALDYVSPAEVTGKPSGGDLREGKVTMPLISYLQSLDADSRESLRARFAAGTLDDEEIARVTAGVERGGLVSDALDEARRHVDAAREALALFPECPEKGILDSVLDYVVRRDR
ncbi:polyprenyl synthetase family protein [Desulfocurvus sp. DL9XJH121]